MFKKVDIVDKIDKYLTKSGHEKVFTIKLSKYNGNDIYIRFDYVAKISAYKIVWVDLNFIDVKKISDYINMQLVTKYLATRLVELLEKNACESGEFLNEKIIGDRVEVINYQKVDPYYFIFDRFLPLEWKELIDPLVIIFSYLPRSMDCILNEIFGKIDGVAENYNSCKPYQFDILNGDLTEIFDDKIIELGKDYFEKGRVSFLEKIRDKYVAIVEGRYPYLVIIHMVDDEHVIMWCNCKSKTYCKHISAVLMAIRKKKFLNFYKVKYLDDDRSLLDKVSDASFYLCFGISEDNLLIISNDGGIVPVPIIKNGKCMFEVLEDDDELSLSKRLQEYK